MAKKAAPTPIELPRGWHAPWCRYVGRARDVGQRANLLGERTRPTRLPGLVKHDGIIPRLHSPPGPRTPRVDRQDRRFFLRLVPFRDRPSPRDVMDTIESHLHLSRPIPRPSVVSSVARRAGFAGFAPQPLLCLTEYRQLRTDDSRSTPDHGSGRSCHASGRAEANTTHYSHIRIVPSAPILNPVATHFAGPQRPCGPMSPRESHSNPWRSITTGPSHVKP